MSERYLYLASYGWCLLLAFAIYYLFNLHFRFSKYLKITTVGFLVAILTFYSVGTVLRNQDWKDSKTLWSKTLAQVPESTLAHYNLGNAYWEEGDLARALIEYQLADSNNHKKLAQVPISLGIVYFKRGQIELAEIELREAISYDENSYQAHLYLGRVFKNQGRLDDAKRYYQRTIAINPNFYDAYIDLGTLYAEIGEIDRAINLFRKAQAIDSKILVSYLNLSLAFEKRGEVDLAIGELKKALSIDSGNEQVRNRLQKLQILLKFQNISKEVE